MTAKYPQRESFFAHKFCRLLTKAAVAQEIGPEACWLLTIIAHQEDVKRYSGPVSFYNGQLLPLCGFDSTGRLIRARAKAVQAGWLHYICGGKGRPGLYWCQIPAGFSDTPDTPTDETDSPLQFQNETGNGTANERQTKRKRTANGNPSYLSPDPKSLTPRNGSLKGVFQEITTKRLSDTPFMTEWHAKASRKNPPLVPAGDAWLFNTIAAAERSLEEGDDPPRLFKWILQNARWDYPSEQQQERARKRILEHRRRDAGPVDPEVAGTAARLAAPPAPVREDDDEAY